MSEDDPATFHDRLDEAAAALDAAQTEAHLDDVEATLEAIATDLEEADLPEPPEPEDEEAEAPPDPRDELEDRLGDLEDDLEDQRGPYASDVIDALERVKRTVDTTEWATEADAELHDAIDPFLDTVEGSLGGSFAEPDAGDIEGIVGVLADTIAAVEAAELDADEDAGTIAALLEVNEELDSEVDAATAFGDLEVREQLNRRGFFDVLGHYTDFPPEWSALKVHESERNVEMILLAYDLLDSNFMEEHCIDALRRLGDERALDPMTNLAQRRDKSAIEVLGKIGSEEPIEMFFDYIETDSDPHLQRVTLRALGEIGSDDATEAVAQQLRAEDDEVRSYAARALGMIGDPRAIAPLEDVLAEDEAAPVRGSAAWALVQIGTEEALETVATFADDGDFLVEAEAAKVTT